MGSPSTTPRTIVVIPTLNEAAHIGSVLAQLLPDPAAEMIWVLDGGSTDETCAHVTAMDDPRVRLIDNPGRTQAAALNLAAGIAAKLGAQTLIRIDAHARYPKGYVSGLVRTLTETGADSVTVPLITDMAQPTKWQEAAALLQRSWIGHGGAAHRRASPSGWVTHGHHAAFRLSSFLAQQGYDTSFAANEDAEFDARLIRSGARIWFAAHLPVGYIPRTGPRATFWQMFRNGQGRAQTAEKHHKPLNLRQLLPVAIVLALALALEAILLMPAPLSHLMALPGLAYIAVLAAGALHLARAQLLVALRIFLLALLSHAGFGLGILRQALWRPRHTPKPRPTPVEAS